MGKREIIGSMMKFFQTAQEIYGVCPTCGDIFRVSDMRIFYGKEPPKDWLSTLTEKEQLLEKQQLQFEVDKSKIIEDAIQRSIAIRIGKTLERIAPIIPRLGVRPSEIRGIFDPVDYVAFNGMLENRIDNICFLELKTGKSSLTKIQRRIRDAVNEGRVEWKEFNITDLIQELENQSPKHQTLNEIVGELPKS
jgi:predicted Holliday junction resolvase-like endonuclease